MKRRILLLATAALLAAGLLWLFLPGAGVRLLDRATRIAAGAQTSSDTAPPTRLWLSDEELLLIRTTARPTLGGGHVMRGTEPQVVRVDGAVPKTRLGPKLVDQLRRNGDNAYAYTVSTDGRWLLFVEGSASAPSVVAWTLDGRDHLRAVHRPTPAFTASDRNVDLLTRTDGPGALGCRVSCWRQATGGAPGEYDILSESLRIPGDLTPLPAPATKRLHLPNGLVIQQISLSPDGKRLAVSASAVPFRAPQSPFHRLTEWLRGPDHFNDSLFVWEMDSGRLREIGRVDTGTADVAQTFPGPHLWDLAWTPDGRRVSFSHRADLYTVPAD